MTTGYTKAEARACDWVEDFDHENGNYWNLCCECERQFIGHKRRVVCKLCAGPPKYVWSQEDIQRFNNALAEVFGWNKK